MRGNPPAALLIAVTMVAAACALEPAEYDSSAGSREQPAVIFNTTTTMPPIDPEETESLVRTDVPPFSIEEFDPAGPVLGQLPPLEGETVTVLGPEVTTAAEGLEFAFQRFTAATGIEVVYTGTGDADVILTDLIEAGEAPDIVMIPQPGRAQDLISDGTLSPLPASIRLQLEAGYDPFWIELMSRGENVYGIPSSANVKSLVWFSPSVFANMGYQVPETFGQLEELVKRIREDGLTPWCVGIASGGASGWPATDWIEDYMLRFQGPGFYDDWVNHRVPFNDERVVSVVQQVGTMWKTPGNVNRVADLTSITFAEAATDHLAGECVLHRQASFIAGNYFDAGASVGPGLDIDAFYLPTVDDRFGQVVLGAGTFAAPISSDPATLSLISYMAAPDYANNRIRANKGGFLSAHRLHDTSLYSKVIDRSMAQILVDADPFRFDASDLMPAQIGTNLFWRSATDYASGSIDAYEMVDEVEANWPR